MAILISVEGQNASLIEKSAFRDEKMLQEYIRKNPEVIPIYEMEEDKKLFVAKREFPTSSGPIDAIAVDKDGDIYVVETKLYKNSDKRKVVAQALDYGAALWKHFNDFNDFLIILSNETRKNFGIDFQDKVTDFFEIDEDELEYMIESLRGNLREGKFKFVILMDSIEERLKDLILYVNQNSLFDIYAVQLEYYEFEKYRIIIPKLFGAEIKKPAVRTGTIKAYDRSSWYEELEKRRSPGEVDIVKRFEEKVKEIPVGFRYSYRRIDERATFWVFSDENFTCRIYGFRVDGKIEISFEKLKKCPPFDDEAKRREFVNRLNKVPGINFAETLKLTGRPSVDITALQNEHSLSLFVEALKWCVNEIKEALDY